MGCKHAARLIFTTSFHLSFSLFVSCITRHKIPPRNLLNLSQRYHNEITMQPLMVQSSSIALLQPGPSWGITSHTDSDWVIRQRMREELGLAKKLNRHQRKNRLKQLGSINSSNGEPAPSGILTVSTSLTESSLWSSSDPSLFDKPSIQALVASGTGPDGRAEARKLRKKRRMMLRSLAVVIVSILVALARNYFFSGKQPMHTPSLPPLVSTPTQQEQKLTRNGLEKDNVSKLLGTHDPDYNRRKLVEKVALSDVTGEDKETVVKEEKPKIADMTDSGGESDASIGEGVGEELVNVQQKTIHDTCDGDEVSCFFVHQA